MATMMSPWAQYFNERFGWKSIELDGGFITYDLKPPLCSIEEFYVPKEKRGTRLGKNLADLVFRLAQEAGCKQMWAKVTPGLPGTEHALRTNLHYGFRLAGVRGTDILLMKEIGGE